MLSSRLFENVLGYDVLPAKSGKDENSIEKETKPSSGTPAVDGVEPGIEIVDACLRGMLLIVAAEPNDNHPSNGRRESVRAISLGATTMMRAFSKRFDTYLDTSNLTRSPSPPWVIYEMVASFSGPVPDDHCGDKVIVCFSRHEYWQTHFENTDSGDFTLAAI